MTRFFERWLLDPPLVGVAIVLSLFGIGMIYSAGVLNDPSFVTGIWMRQLVWFVLALIAFTVVTRIDPRWLEWAAGPAYAVALVLLALTLVFGTGAGTAAGVESWIRIGPIRFQPSEVAKLATILALARISSNWQEPPQNLRALVPALAIVGAPLLLVLAQPDLGTAMAFIGILFAVLFWAGTPVAFLLLLASPGLSLILSFNTVVWSTFFVVILAGLYLLRYRIYLVESIAVVLANLAAGTAAQPLWNELADYQRNRILVYLDPQVDPLGAGYQVIQSKIAIGSGGWFGKGFTLGTQKRFDFLPEQHTDFIFSVVGEELGFIGAVAALLLFGLLLLRLIHLAQGASDPFAGLVIFGIFGAWLVHIFVNVGMTVGVVPITGIPLPFLSYGGTFLLMSWVAVALAVRVVRER